MTKQKIISVVAMAAVFFATTLFVQAADPVFRTEWPVDISEIGSLIVFIICARYVYKPLKTKGRLCGKHF